MPEGGSMSRPRAARICTVRGCPEIVTGASRCPAHVAEADARRGSSSSRGYDRAHQRARSVVLDRDPICVLCHAAPSTVADHYPRDRRELVRLGLDPNDPSCMRGLCAPCHGRETARLQPGGYIAPH